VGGAKISLASLVCSAPPEQTSQLALAATPDEHLACLLGERVEKVHVLPLPNWIRRTPSGFGNSLLTWLARAKRGGYWIPVMKLARIIRKERIDLVHTNVGICPMGAYAARIAKRPHVWHVREPLGTQGEYPLTPGDERAARLFQKLSAAIICNSQYTAGFFRNHDIEPLVIYNGIDLSLFEDAQHRGQLLRSKLGLGPNQTVVGMVGSLRADWKEHDLFLKSAAILHQEFPECRFVVFGGLSNLDLNPYTRSVRDLAIELGLQGALVFADFIDDVPAMMTSLDILAHPTSKEGSGRVVMEAMAAGRPVVGVQAGGVQETIQHGATGFLTPPRDAPALAEALKCLLRDDELREKMGTQARAYAWEHYSLARTAESIHSVYEEILTHHVRS
jgi:glycosyltransferase involved in cell wall biosynthesis